MKPSKSPMTNRSKQIFQFKIGLTDIKPAIWRRILVPGDYSFWDLHVAIQDAMGWADYHLHEFTILNPANGLKEGIGIPDDDFPDENPMLPGWELAIADYFSMENTQAEYLYDFGDGWKHKILLEKIIPRKAGVSYPSCIAGERACPPEDCGGVWGYQELLVILNDPEHDEFESMKYWVGGKYDPESFDADKVSFDDPDKRWKLAFDQ